MRKVSVIGAGQAGLIVTYALRRAGHDVTLYSDRTADQWLNHAPPTGTAFLYQEVIDIERELGMDFWSEGMHSGSGVLLDFKPAIAGDERMVVAGSFGGDGGAIDQRLRIHRWLTDLPELGGKLVIESVTPERVDEIAAASDLTLLAAGKAELGRLIPRHEERSVYDRPQRHLAMAIVAGVEGFGDRVDFTPVKFNFYGDAGEYFWVPYTHKTAGATWCVLFEARPGGPLDRFGGCKSGPEVVEVARALIEEHAPWEWDAVKGMTYVEGDDHGWLVGRFPPTVRQAFGRLPSGALLMPVGDTAITFDPIGGQGGNHASRNAKYIADRVIERGEGAFDKAWMTEVSETWWERYGRWAYTFNNALLEPITAAAGTLLAESARNRAFADAHFFGNFAKPADFYPSMADADAARELVASFCERQALTA